MRTHEGPLEILSSRLEADPSLVVLRPFSLGWQASSAPSERARQLLDRILALTEEQVGREYARVAADFGERHWQTDGILMARYRELTAALELDRSAISADRARLIGAYFCHEYTYAAAALMNPSVVPHPDQSGMIEGATRIILTLRAVGEGHISSIAFREGILEPGGEVALWPQAHFATSLEVEACEGDAVVARRQRDSTLTNTVVFPMTEAQHHGLEDLRMVRFLHDDGTSEWIGTFTAYSGTTIRSELVRTRDFRRFAFAPVQGRAGRDKGMALFPRMVGGQFAMVGRQDGRNLYLLRSDTLETWDQDGALLLEPRYPWEFVQIGNCGSPIETDRGWLLLTHGVGPVRRYAIGCVLLDRDDPSRVIARSPRPLLSAHDDDRNGYVPNVVYTCGAYLTEEGVLFLPYGISDSAIGFARGQIADVFEWMEPV